MPVYNASYYMSHNLEYSFKPNEVDCFAVGFGTIYKRFSLGKKMISVAECSGRCQRIGISSEESVKGDTLYRPFFWDLWWTLE